jgi:tetratricopeptide (TPR) repeat protein
MRLAVVFLALSAAVLAQAGLHIREAVAAYTAGKAAEGKGRHEDAASLFRKALAIEPTYVEAHEGLIEAYLRSDRQPDAEAAMTRLLEIEPQLAKYRVLLGTLLLKDNQAQRALAQFSAALQSDADQSDADQSDADQSDADQAGALLGFASAAQQLGMNDRAADALERGRKRYPRDTRFKPQPASGKTVQAK